MGLPVFFPKGISLPAFKRLAAGILEKSLGSIIKFLKAKGALSPIKRIGPWLASLINGAYWLGPVIIFFL